MKKQATLIAAAMSAAISLPAISADSMRLVIEYQNGQGDAVKAALAERGIDVLRDLADYDSLALNLTKEQFADLRSVAGIAEAYPDVPRKLLSTGELGEISPYGIAMTQANKLSYNGGTKVCIIDSGYDYGHPDLPAANVFGEMGLSGPWNEDDHSHGTHVAGTIAAVGNGEGVVGVNSDANMNLHIVRVFDADGGFAYASDLVGAVNDCAAAGANVISMSLGGGIQSPIEERAMDRATRDGILIIAAAGNDENAAHSYPASYDSVMSVAAIDSGNNHAYFSQRTAQVEIAGPGVNTLSTVPRGMGTGGVGQVSQAENAFEAAPAVGSATGSITALVTDCGLGTEACADAAGKICLIERGEIAFGEKVANCEAGGGVGTILYNNVPGSFGADLGGDTALVAVSLSQAEGEAMVAGMEANITIQPMADYDYKSGTSMATPHVSGIAALVWSHFPECSGTGIRLALRETAKDLGPDGYDYQFGWGLVQAKDAYDYIAANGCKSPKGKIHGGDGSAR
ncbi:S8 family serine peptidase [Parahaliea maris]|uniref:S8 family serine peptidase n=1 Tax=Parahaliea maris TaxID=2716870 RepID=A0A5C9A7I2_9GAMM|nr:S8 family serine peptidase [Parahaliea maris]TXS95181.1 S8 family serine peptidase [Parahaliea maris]